MNSTTPTERPITRRNQLVFAGCCLMSAIVGAGVLYIAGPTRPPAGVQSPNSEDHEGGAGHDDGDGQEEANVTLPKAKWEAAGIRIAKVTTNDLTDSDWVTGKVSLNQDRVAHLYSLVEGRVHSVNVQFGDDVSEGAKIAVIDSREVGTAKLALSQSRLDAEFARVNNDWQQKVTANTLALIKALSDGVPLAKIDEQFGDRPMGDYRQQLLTALANLSKSRADFERLEPLSGTGAVAGRSTLAAKTALDADQAQFDALREQLKFTAPQQALLSEQQVKQAEQAVAAAKSQLFILGYTDSDLENLNPGQQGEGIAHFEIRAPFDGTVLAKNVVLEERVGTDTEMFQIADLSSVWIEADIYQKDLPKLTELGDELQFRVPILSGVDGQHSHQARIFYKGDVLDESTRTLKLRAVLDNPERHLKPGMFVEVKLPGATISDVLVIDASAVQTDENNTFVFVHQKGDEFERRNVTLGTSSGGLVQVREGLKAGEQIVVEGGFSLKSELMKGQISHGH